MSLPYCNGIKIRGLNQDAGNVAVQSSTDSTWMLVRRKWKFMPAQWMDKAIQPNELVHIKAQDSSAQAVIELQPMGDSSATLVCRSNRDSAKTMRVGQTYRFELTPGEALMLYNPNIQHPTSGGTPGVIV
jgi:hypothetical protein